MDIGKVEKENEIKVEESMDVLVVYPGPKAELITIASISDPFETYFKSDDYFNGFNPHDGCKFAFMTDTDSKKKEKNIRIGVNPLFANIHGPIVFAYDHLSINKELALKIVKDYDIEVFEDNRLFKNRPAYKGPKVTKEKLIDLNPLFEPLYKSKIATPTNEDRIKYFVEDYECLSMAVYQLLKSGRGGFFVNFARKSGWNPYSSGINSAQELTQLASSILEQFEEYLEREIEDISEGKSSIEEATSTATKLYYWIDPIKTELQKVINSKK